MIWQQSTLHIVGATDKNCVIRGEMKKDPLVTHRSASQSSKLGILGVTKQDRMEIGGDGWRLET